MPSLEDRLAEVFPQISLDTRRLRNWVTGGAMDLSALTTTTKTTIIAAINEVKAQANGIINDAAASNSTVATYSASKITALISQSAADTRSQLLGGASAAWDTLQELKDLIDANTSNDSSSAAALMAALAKRVRVDAAQTFTAPEKAQGRSNIEAVWTTDVGNTNRDWLSLYNQGQA